MNKKRIILVVLTLTMLFTTCGCSLLTKTSSSSEKEQVTTQTDESSTSSTTTTSSSDADKDTSDKKEKMEIQDISFEYSTSKWIGVSSKETDKVPFMKVTVGDIVLALRIESAKGLSDDECNEQIIESLKERLNDPNGTSADKVINGYNVKESHFNTTSDGEQYEAVNYVFMKNGYAYMFLVMQPNKVSDETYKSVEEVLNTVKFK